MEFRVDGKMKRSNKEKHSRRRERERTKKDISELEGGQLGFEAIAPLFSVIKKDLVNLTTRNVLNKLNNSFPSSSLFPWDRLSQVSPFDDSSDQYLVTSRSAQINSPTKRHTSFPTLIHMATKIQVSTAWRQA